MYAIRFDLESTPLFQYKYQIIYYFITSNLCHHCSPPRGRAPPSPVARRCDLAGTPPTSSPPCPDHPAVTLLETSESLQLCREFVGASPGPSSLAVNFLSVRICAAPPPVLAEFRRAPPPPRSEPWLQNPFLKTESTSS